MVFFNNLFIYYMNTPTFSQKAINSTVSKQFNIPFTLVFPSTATATSQNVVVYAPTDCEVYKVNSIFVSVYHNAGSYNQNTDIKPLITLQIQNQSTSEFLYNAPIDVFSVNSYSNLRKFEDMEFLPRTPISITAYYTNTNSVVPVAPLTVQATLFGTKHNFIVN